MQCLLKSAVWWAVSQGVDIMKRPNLLFLLVDQLSAMVLNTYGHTGVQTPNLDALSARGVTFDNMVSTCPVCTPFRSMWLTGRHPQTTGHVINTVTTRYDEIGWGDVFSHAGYDTGYIGKWHLHAGGFPDRETSGFYVPEGRARLGFKWWRSYNLIASFFDGEYNLGNTGRSAKWEGYEPAALTSLAWEFIDNDRNPGKPFCLMVCPHQPHLGGGNKPGRMAPDEFYDRLPDPLPRPAMMPEKIFAQHEDQYRHYYAMILSIDDMVGELVRGLEARGILDSTILAFSSDHGTHLGVHPVENTNPFWTKKRPFETNVKVPLIVRWPGGVRGGTRCDTLTSPVDLLPTFCGMCGIDIPSSVEGMDLSRSWLNEAGAAGQDAGLMMNFAWRFSYAKDGWEWRGIRTKTHTYARYLTGETYLFNNDEDPYQQNNLMDGAAQAEQELALECERRMNELLARRNDALHPGSFYADWFDEDRRIIRNAYGPLGDPEAEPDWSQLAGGVAQ